MATAATTSLPSPGLTCEARIYELRKEWNAISFPSAAKPGQARVVGKGGREHTAGEIDYMRGQMRLAAKECNERREPEANARVDKVRALLKLSGG